MTPPSALSALLGEVTQSVEGFLYQAMRGLEETHMLLQALGERFAQDPQAAVAALFFRKAKEASGAARQMHETILQHESFSGDLQFRPR